MNKEMRSPGGELDATRARKGQLTLVDSRRPGEREAGLGVSSELGRDPAPRLPQLHGVSVFKRQKIFVILQAYETRVKNRLQGCVSARVLISVRF